jgi:hypothetical protein
MWDLWSAISATHFSVAVISTTEENAANCYKNDFRSDDPLEQVRDPIDKVIFTLDDMNGGSLKVAFTLIIPNNIVTSPYRAFLLMCSGTLYNKKLMSKAGRSQSWRKI